MSFSVPSCSKTMSPQADFSGKPAISHLPLLSVQFHSSHVCKTRVHLRVHSGGAKVGVGAGNAQLGHVDSPDKGSRLPLANSQAAEQPRKPTNNPPGGDLSGDGPGTCIKKVTDGTHIGFQGEESGVPLGQRGGTSYTSQGTVFLSSQALKLGPVHFCSHGPARLHNNLLFKSEFQWLGYKDLMTL